MLKQRLNVKKCLVIALFLIIASLAVLIIFSNQKSLRYGYYEHVNQDGSISSIRLLKDSVFCDNLDYDGEEGGAATWLAREQWKSEGREYNWESPEFQALRQTFLEKLNFKEVFDKKEIPIKEMIRDDEYDAYWIDIRNPQDDTQKIELMYVISRGVLVSMGEDFKYVGKEPSSQ